MYTALYRAYRPEKFSELLGQDHIVKILENQLKTDTVSHAYLFCGTRGTGKTTTARLLAKGVNCTGNGEIPCDECENCKAIKEGIFMDVIEIDAASNNGVDNIRELRESVKYPPAMGKKKVYIIDEVHMLSTGAFNALLKTLEEPPEHVMFILATTEPQKLPATILSRCMRLDFHRVPENILAEGMEAICEKQGVSVDSRALSLIAANADGSVRDGLSILDQCISAGQASVSRDDILELLGTAGEEVFIELTDAVKFRKVAEGLLIVDKALADGKDVRQFMKDWLEHFRKLLIVKFVKDPEDILNMSAENLQRIRNQSDIFELGDLDMAIIELSKAIADGRWSTQPRILLELCLVKLASGPGRQGLQTSAGKPTLETAVRKEPVKKEPVHETADRAEEQTEPPKPTDRPEKGVKETSISAGSADDYQEIWQDIFEEGEASKGSFNLIRNGTKLISVTDSEFTVEVTNGAVAQYVEKNREILTDMMERHTKVKRAMRCVQGTEKRGKTPEVSIEEIAEDAKNKLGVDIEIE